jgi:beta-lactamase class D
LLKFALSLIVLFAVPFYGIASDSGWQETPSLGKFFADAGVKGCFLLFDLQKNEYIGFNLKRAKSPFIPASTFKIFNSLVALQTGAVRDEAQIIQWDGRERKFPVWNQDQDMRNAIRNSTVWFYQELARRIGQERMQYYMDLANYGNRDISGGIDQFWLEGGLRMTSQQQIELLVGLYRNKLPFSQRTGHSETDLDRRESGWLCLAGQDWLERRAP